MSWKQAGLSTERLTRATEDQSTALANSRTRVAQMAQASGNNGSIIQALNQGPPADAKTREVESARAAWLASSTKDSIVHLSVGNEGLSPYETTSPTCCCHAGDSWLVQVSELRRSVRLQWNTTSTARSPLGAAEGLVHGQLTNSDMGSGELPERHRGASTKRQLVALRWRPGPEHWLMTG